MSFGIGVRSEKEFPYLDSKGNEDDLGDWSIPESERFGSVYVLKNTNILPNPALRDKDNNYVYNPFGTEAIKSELMKGRAVGIAYYADQSMPAPARELIDAHIYELKKRLFITGMMWMLQRVSSIQMMN